jgi:hypothetical protein
VRVANNGRRVYNCGMPLILIFLTFLFPISHASIGTVTVLKGMAEIRRANQIRPLKLNESLEEHDLVTTMKSSLLKIQMIDQTSIQLGPESSLELATYKQTNQLRQQIFNLVKGKMRTIVEQKAKEGELLQFKSASVSLGVRGTHFLMNSSTVLGLPSSDVALLEGKVAADLAPAKIPLPEFAVEEGQYFSTHQIAKDKTLDSIQKLSQEQIAKLLENGESFLPDLLDAQGKALNLASALAAGAGLGIGVVAAAGNLIPSSGMVAGQENNEKPPAAPTVIHTKETITQIIYKEKAEPDPEDIRTAKEDRIKKRKVNECYYWIYKVIPGSGAERFRRERNCDEYDFDL